MLGEMANTKLIKVPLGAQQTRPSDRRSIYRGPSLYWAEEAEFRCRTQVAGNHAAISQIFNSVFDDLAADKRVLGPFFLTGRSGSGKNTLANSIGDLAGSSYLRFNLGSCKTPADMASLVGAPPGFEMCERGTVFSNKLSAMADSLAKWTGPVESKPIAVVCFSNADKAHPAWMDVLKEFLTSGTFRTHAGQEIAMERVIVIFTGNGIGEDVEALRHVGASEMPVAVRRALLNYRQVEGIVPFRDEFVDICTLVPVFEPTPDEIVSFLSYTLARPIGIQHGGLTDRTAGRARLGSTLLERAWNNAGLTTSDYGRAIIKKVTAAWDAQLRTRPVAKQLAATLGHRPAADALMILGLERDALVAKETPVSSLVDTPVNISLPLPYLERIGFQVARGDYWELPANLQQQLDARITGQAPVIADLVGKLATRIAEPYGALPITSFIAVGPTGSGKTALGQAISEITRHPLIFCECNTWSTERDLWENLFGDGPKSLLSQIRNHPASVVLLDEVDKAHQSLWKYWMTVNDTGMISDPVTGRSISLRHSIVELTSNYLATELAAIASLVKEKPLAEIDPLLRTALGRCASIDTACLERLDSAYLMMPLEGVNSYALWQKFVTEKTAAMGLAVTTVAPEVAAFLETQHRDKGGSAGARARRRTVDEWLGAWGRKQNTSFAIEDGCFTLSPTGLLQLEDFPVARSERQRMWAVTEAKVANLRKAYTGNDELIDFVIESIRRESQKVNPRSPVNSILLVGPTGQGKTYLGNAIASSFGKAAPVVIECVQCTDSNADAVAPLLFGGANMTAAGRLTSPVLHRQDQVVVFDEITQQNATLVERIMSVLDEGRATDMTMQLPVDLKQCLFIMTSNVCCDEIEARMRQMDGASMLEKEAATREIIGRSGLFRPEQLARIKWVLPVFRNATGGLREADVQIAISNVLDEYGQSDVTVDAVAFAEIYAACHVGGSTDARSVKKVVESLLAPVLLAERNAGLELREKQICKAA